MRVMGRLWWGSRCALLLVVVPAVVLPGGVAHAGADGLRFRRCQSRRRGR